MNVLVHLMHFPLYSLGPGTRIGLWFQGCTLHCRGCVTPESWSFDPERSMPLDAAAEKIRLFLRMRPYPDGLTISGGEPFDQPEALFELLRKTRSLGVRDVLIYSGYRAEFLLERYPELAGLASALVDGQFELGNTTDSVWKGSGNQKLMLFEEALSQRYEAWTQEQKRKLQLVGSGGNTKLLIGIPRQEDVQRLKDPFSRDK